MRVKVDFRSGSRSNYIEFKNKYPHINLPFDEWFEIVQTYNKLFRDYLLETGERAKLPYGLGGFAISKKKIKKLKYYDGKEYVNLPIDWQKSRKAGKRIYNFNTHSDGYRLKWLWFYKEARFFNSEIWMFKPARETSRKITEYLRKPMQIEMYKQWERR